MTYSQAEQNSKHAPRISHASVARLVLLWTSRWSVHCIGKSRNLGPPTSRDQRKLALWHGCVEPRLSEACVTISRSYEEEEVPTNPR